MASLELVKLREEGHENSDCNGVSIHHSSEILSINQGPTAAEEPRAEVFRRLCKHGPTSVIKGSEKSRLKGTDLTPFTPAVIC